MFKVQIENQDKKVIIEFTADTLANAKALAEDQVNKALAQLVNVTSATAFVWNLDIGGIDAMLDADGWDY
jgi:uncharacterized protein involved in tolerance to divalent cations